MQLLGKLDQIRQKKPSMGTIHSPGRHTCGAQEGDVQSRGKALRVAGCPEEGQHLLRTQVPHGRDCHESSFQRRTVQSSETSLHNQIPTQHSPAPRPPPPADTSNIIHDYSCTKSTSPPQKPPKKPCHQTGSPVQSWYPAAQCRGQAELHQFPPAVGLAQLS